MVCVTIECALSQALITERPKHARPLGHHDRTTQQSKLAATRPDENLHRSCCKHESRLAPTALGWDQIPYIIFRHEKPRG